MTFPTDAPRLRVAVLFRIFLTSCFVGIGLLCPGLADPAVLAAPVGLPAAFPQTELTSGLRGTVKTQSGDVVPGAQVVVVNSLVHLNREVQTDTAGRFALLGLPPGSGYRVEVRADNFRAASWALNALASSETLTVDFTLEVSGVDEIIQVVGETGVVSNAPEVSQTLDARRVTELPSNGRSLNKFALLDPHVRNTAGLGADTSGGSRLAINANSFRHTSYRLDGNSNYESVFANAPQQQVSLASVQEFKVLTNQYSAEYGGSTAGIVSATTKTGTDRFHGDGFVFLRPSGIQARPPVASLRVPNQLWQYGGSFSGPVVRDRLNFFANYESARSARGAFIQSPQRSTFVGEQTDHLALLRLDSHLSSTHTLDLRVNGNTSRNTNPNDAVSAFTQPSAARLSVLQSVAAQLTDRKSWGAKLNELRFSYVNAVPSASSPLNGPAVTVVRPNYATEGTSSYSYVRTKSFQLADQFAWQTGKHEMRFGGDILRQNVRDDAFSLFGTYTFAPGAPRVGETPVQFQQTLGRALLNYGQTAISAYVQDNWRIHPRLTLNLGLRYENQTLTDERNNFAPRLGFAWDAFGNGKTIVRGGGGVYYDQYYFYITRRFLYQGVNSPTATYTLKPTDAGFPKFPNSLTAPPGGIAAARLDLYLAPDRILNPYSTQFSFGIQQKLPGGFTLTVDGITSHTVRQMRPIDLNAPKPFTRTAAGQIRSSAEADATRPFKTFQGVPVRNAVVIENTANSDYDALDLGIVRSFANRFQFEGHYVYSNATTDSMFFGEPNTGVPSDWNGNLRLEHGPSDYHQRHRFVGHGLIEMPWRSQASFVVTVASGLPVDPRTGVDNNGDSNLVDRPLGLGRNSFRGPLQASFDLSFSKKIVLREGVQLELRAEGFNLFNRSNFVRVNATYGNGVNPLPTFLAPLAGISNADPGRQFQFATRLTF